MRVLDPTTRNPVYWAHDKMTKTIGDGGDIALSGALVAAPVGAGLFIDSIWSLLSILGFYGYTSYFGYKSRTKNKSRITTLVDIQHRLPANYRPALDKMVKEVFDCTKQHYEFRTSDTIGYRYKITLGQNSMSTDTVRFRETEEQFKVRQAEEKILKAGYGCKFCGNRITAAQVLLDECQAAEIEDNLSVDSVLAIAAAKREANIHYKQFMESESAAMKELMA